MTAFKLSLTHWSKGISRFAYNEENNGTTLQTMSGKKYSNSKTWVTAKRSDSKWLGLF